jgi:RNA polymerase sigma-70 factor (ECF subfamily)
MSRTQDPPAPRLDVDRLAAELQPALLRAARRWAPAETVDDVVQDTWLGVIRGIERFEGRSQPSTWVFGILWRQCCRQWRKIDAKPTVHIGDEEIASDKADIDPGHVAEVRDALARTFDAIEDLPDRYREVILLRDVLDTPAAETCDAMNLSEANQRVLLHRARGRVRSSLPDLAALPARAGDELLE